MINLFLFIQDIVQDGFGGIGVHDNAPKYHHHEVILRHKFKPGSGDKTFACFPLDALDADIDLVKFLV